MADPTKIAVDALENKALALIREQKEIRRRLLADSLRDVQIERDIVGCVSGARALGYPLELPDRTPKTPQLVMAVNNFNSGRQTIAANAQTLVPWFAEPVDDDDADEMLVLETSAERPRVADVAVERLKAAGSNGAKAADIRNYIEQTYHTQIHEKTVGMTLYRLQKDGVVRRDGHTWFLA
jgi:hypothetical protein